MRDFLKDRPSKEFGEIDYSEREYLYPGAQFPETIEAPVELDILDMSGNDDWRDADRAQVEAEFVTNRLKELVESAKYITVVFLFLMILCSPHYAMSTDYVDCLDMNETPPEGSQCWIAPFIQNFIKNNIKLIDSNCLDYLKNNTPMQFD